jgi:hypothetical protein
MSRLADSPNGLAAHAPEVGQTGVSGSTLRTLGFEIVIV